MEFKHPKYYAALRAEKRKLQAASSNKRRAISLKKARNIIFNHKDVKERS